MTARHAVLVGVALVASAVPLALSARQNPPQATFRSSIDLVPVNVSVRENRSFTPGLGVDDFALDDNGVRQQITGVSTDPLSVDVTVVVDTSGSVVGSLDAFKSDVKKIAAALRPDEQLRVVTFETDVREVVPMQSVAKGVSVAGITKGDRTSLIDALLFALSRARRPDRRHLVFVFTDGYDNVSLLDYGALPEIASRSDAVLHIVQVKVPGVPDEGWSAAFKLLASAATRTGGALYPPSNETTDIVAAFKQAVEAFRHSYVLYFTPQGVSPGGFHRLTVRVLKAGTFDVHAREGYYGAAP